MRIASLRGIFDDTFEQKQCGLLRFAGFSMTRSNRNNADCFASLAMTVSSAEKKKGDMAGRQREALPACHVPLPSKPGVPCHCERRRSRSEAIASPPTSFTIRFAFPVALPSLPL